MSPPLFLLMQRLKFKRVVRVTKNKVRTPKIAVSRAVKDQVPSLPGISKIQIPEPSFPHLLQSNTPPTYLEAIEILQAISTIEVQSLHLQEIIQDHGPDRTVEHQLHLANQFVHAHRDILSVIRRIPPEVLQAIFCQMDLPWQDCRWNTIPWALSQVCQRWRTIALSTASLWSNFPSIHLQEKTPRSYVAQIKELLVRSRNAPISFRLCAHDKSWKSHPIIDALIRHSDRWQAVTIYSTNLTIVAFEGVKGRLSSLRTLSGVKRTPWCASACLKTPHNSLTCYKERVRERGIVHHAVSLATSLTTLEITRYPESPKIPLTTLPFLVTLKVQFVTFQHEFLDRLTLPVIQEIWITGYAANYLITDMIDMISRSHSPCILKKLAFRVSQLGELNSGELTRLLGLTPDLVALDLPLPPLKDLANLIIRRNKRPLLPLLHTLRIHTDAIRRPETGQLLNAIAFSRCSLQDSFASTVQPHLPSDFQALKELRITFEKPTVCHYELRYLEDWVPSEESEQLIIWKEKLLQELPELQWPVPPKRKPDPKLHDRVFDIFSNIEKFHVKNVDDVYTSEIHVILRNFTNRPATPILSQFGDRAGKILETWTPLFESHIKERRWLLKGSRSLVYLSIDDDALRLSPTCLDIVYGLDDNPVRFPEIFWSMYIFCNYEFPCHSFSEPEFCLSVGGRKRHDFHPELLICRKEVDLLTCNSS